MLQLNSVHGIDKNCYQFLTDNHILVHNGVILAVLNIETQQQSQILSLTEYDFITAISCNCEKQCLAIAIQGISVRIEIYKFKPSSNGASNDIKLELVQVIDECSDVGYSHLNISHDAQYMIAISNTPDLNIEYWSFQTTSNSLPEKLCSSAINPETKICEFSPINNQLFATATDHQIVLWRVYYKFDQYFLTSIVHNVKHSESNPRKLTSMCWILSDKNDDSKQPILFDSNECLTQLMYSTTKGELVWFDESNATSMNIVHIVDNIKPIFQLFYTALHYIIVFENGECIWLDRNRFSLQYKYTHEQAIEKCNLLPSYAGIVILDTAKSFHLLRFHTKLMSGSFESSQNLIVSTKIAQFCQKIDYSTCDILPIQANNQLVIISNPIQLLNVKTLQIDSLPIYDVTCASVLHCKEFIDIFGFGYKDGCVGLASILTPNNGNDIPNTHVIWKEKIFQTSVKDMCFDYSGTILCVMGQDDPAIWFIYVPNQTILGYIQLEEVPLSISTASTESDSLMQAIFIVSMPIATTIKFEISNLSDQSIVDQKSFIKSLKHFNAENNNLSFKSSEIEIIKSATDSDIFKLDFQPTSQTTDFTPICMKLNLNNPNEVYHVMENKCLKKYVLNEDFIIYEDESFEFAGHKKNISTLFVRNQIVITGSQDGMLMIQDSQDSDAEMQRYIHNCGSMGISHVAATCNNKYIVSIGQDGSVFSWKFTDSQTLNDLFENECDYYQFDCPISRDNLKSLISKKDEYVMNQELQLYHDNITSKCKTIMHQLFLPDKQNIEKQITEMRQIYQQICDKNTMADEFSKLDKSELIVDIDTYTNLNNQANDKINTLKDSIHYQDLGKQLIARRIKEECWNSMQQTQQVVTAIESEKQIQTFPQKKPNRLNSLYDAKLQFLIKTSLFEHCWSEKTQDKIPTIEFNEIQLLSNNKIDYVWDINDKISKDISLAETMPCVSKNHMGIINLIQQKIESWNKIESNSDGSNQETQNSTNEGNKMTEMSNNKSSSVASGKKIVGNAIANQSSQNVSNTDDISQWSQQYATPLSIKYLLFAPSALHSNFRKRIQIQMLHSRISHVCSEYNKEVIQLLKNKEIEIERINEMITEIKEIYKELETSDKKNSSETINYYSMNAIERENEKLFLVSDNEVKIEKVLTEQERIEKQRQLEIEQQRLAQNDNNFAERALTEMMNNTLDTKDEVERLQDTLKKPQFMDEIDEANYTDEQKIQASRYNAKMEELMKAKEIRQKLLKTRLKQLKTDISDICKNFDNKHMTLYQKRQCIKQDKFVHELMLLHLCNNLIEGEQNAKRLENINDEIAQLKQDKLTADDTFANFQFKLDEAKKLFQEMQNEEKLQEKQFKREFSHLTDYYDAMFKIFKGKKGKMPKMKQSPNAEKRGSRDELSESSGGTVKRSHSKLNRRKSKSQKSVNMSDTSLASDTVANNSSNQDQMTIQVTTPKKGQQSDKNDVTSAQTLIENESLQPISSHTNYNPYTVGSNLQSQDRIQKVIENIREQKPGDVDDDTWDTFLQFKKTKLEATKEMNELNDQIESMTAEINALKANQSYIDNSLDELHQMQKRLQQSQIDYKCDSELYVRLKQGQVEIAESPVVTDMRHSVLLQKDVIEELNCKISKAGEEYIERLNEIKKFRRGINLLNWKAKYLDIENQYYSLLTTEYQLRRVTKKDQEVIKAGGHESKYKSQVTSLNKKIDFTNKTYEKKFKEKKHELKILKTKLHNINRSNQELDQQIVSLANDVAKKTDIVQIKGTESISKQNEKTLTKKMDSIMTRRKLVDLISAQSEELDFLQAELDRLRQQTFPSFAVTSENIDTNNM